MSLQIEQREREGTVILDLKGPLTLGHGDLELLDRLPSLHQSGKVNIILNLQEVSHIDRTGLGTLVFGLAMLRRSGGRLALLNLNRSHLELFLLTKLAIAFEFFDDEQDAVNSFFPDRALKHYDVLDFETIAIRNARLMRMQAARIEASVATSSGFGPAPHR